MGSCISNQTKRSPSPISSDSESITQLQELKLITRKNNEKDNYNHKEFIRQTFKEEFLKFDKHI